MISSRKLWKTHLQLPDPPSRCGVPTIFWKAQRMAKRMKKHGVV
jgi:hypothetical protein